MNLIFRLIAVILGAFYKPRVGVSDVGELHGRVWPLDLDLNMHMTNSRYLALMDLGRTDLILRSGRWRVMREEKLGVVLAGAAMRFRRSLPPFSRFTLSTRMLGWDERWVYVEQIFTGPQGEACIAVVRAAFVKKGKLVPPGPVIADGDASPEIPAWVKEWSAVEDAFAAK